MLDNDYTLPISFSMATQIGLEETVLLTFLKQQAYVANTRALRIEVGQLNTQLPFWTVPIVMRLLNNLQISQLLSFQQQDNLILIQLAGGKKSNQATSSVQESGTQEDDLMLKMDRLHKASRDKKEEFTPQVKNNSATPSTHSFTTPTFSAPSQRSTVGRPVNEPSVANDRRGVTDFDLYLEQKERSRQPDQWQPEEATLEQITQLGVTREFALSLQTEFLLRIKEQRKNVRTWNSEFFKYVKRQWQYKQSDRSSYEGTSDSSKFTKTSREQVSDALTNIHDTDW